MYAEELSAVELVLWKEKCLHLVVEESEFLHLKHLSAGWLWADLQNFSVETKSSR